jgi:hypothetical protein
MCHFIHVAVLGCSNLWVFSTGLCVIISPDTTPPRLVFCMIEWRVVPIREDETLGDDLLDPIFDLA